MILKSIWSGSNSTFTKSVYVSRAIRTETLTVYLFPAFFRWLQSSLELSDYREGNMEALDIRWHIERGKCVTEHHGR